MIKLFYEKNLKVHFKKISFVFKEIYKAGPGLLIFSTLSMIISGISPALVLWATFCVIGIFEHNLENINIIVYIKIFSLITIIICSAILVFFAENVKSILSQITGLKLSYNIETLIADKFQYIKQEQLDIPNFLDLYKNTLDKSGYEPINVVETFFRIISTASGLFGYSAIVLSFNTLGLCLIIVCAIPVFYLKKATYLKTYRFLKNNAKHRRQTRYFFSLISEPEYAKEIRLFGLFEHLKIRREHIFNNFIKDHIRIFKKETFYTVISVLLSIIGTGTVEILLAFDVLNDVIPVSKFILYSTAIIYLEIGLLSLIGQIAANNKSLLFLNYLFDFLKIQTDDSKQKHIELSDLKDNFKIEFVDVSFKYPHSKKHNIKNVSFEFTIGEKLCFIGENGSGKSTLLKLLLRIYEPSEGEILINGKNVKEYNIESYRKLFGVVFQDYINYAVDVKSCIGFGNIDNIENLKLIKSAAKKAKSDKFIDSYSNQYNTNLSKRFYEDSVEPSIGQWQRLAISRAIFSDAPILILDEPTSALDLKTEKEIFEMFDNNSQEKAFLIISHKMRSTYFADKVILLDDGKIIECGSHSSLIEAKGKYFELYSLYIDKITCDTVVQHVAI